jgi:hypothetical protein
MARKTSYLLFVGVVALTAILGNMSTVWARAQVLGATTYESNGALISGWNWVRATGESATWVFDAKALGSAKPNSIYLNITPLVTNGTDGGSGYKGAVQLQIEGSKPHQGTTVLTNPFRPTDPQNSSGIGYQTYGSAIKIPPSVLKNAETIKVTLTFKPSYKFHVAVNKSCMTIGYSL